MILSSITTRTQIPEFISAHQLKRICEIGVREGRHLQALLVPCVREMVAVDIWQEDGVASHNDKGYSQQRLDQCYEMVCAMAKQDPRISIIRDYSTAAADLFLDSYFDLVYIDADHTYEAVHADIEAWWPKIAPGGYLSGHDYVKAVVGDRKVPFGVIEAVSEFLRINPRLTLHTTTDRFASWFIKKI